MVAIVALVILCVIATVLMRSVARAMRSESRWHRTTGRIRTFLFNHGAPAVSYEYEVDGQPFTASAIVPGPFYGAPGEVTLHRSVYLDRHGSLKFPTGASVDVYYDPQNPADAALVTGVQKGAAKGFVGLFLFALAIGSAWYFADWIALHKNVSASAAFFLGGCLTCLLGVKGMLRHQRTQRFYSTPGALTRAEVAFVQPQRKRPGGYTAAVEFEYEVDGRIYRSNQLTALSARFFSSKPSAIETMIERLRARPELEVRYDPRAPWDGFLLYGPWLGTVLPLVMGMLFFGVAWLMLILIR